jgi:cyclopropane-fatty-acyl-phospholipid synthase
MIQSFAEKGWLPDVLIRIGIRRLLAERLREAARQTGPDAPPGAKADFYAATRSQPLAVDTRAANEQHYEVPSAFFVKTLGPRLKYSCALWPDDVHDLATAEERMLRLTCERAGLKDGQQILELGCGWGSLSLWMAEQFPESTILAVSNSHSQRTFIEERAAAKGLTNLSIVTCDMNDFTTDRTFDRVVSVEMFEHMRNHAELLHRIDGWLKPNGQLFVHIFCHRDWPYLFETEGANNWMGRHFFTGGMMPSFDIFAHHTDSLRLRDAWKVSGLDYSRTLEAWLQRMDAQESELRAILAPVYGAEHTTCWWNRWRMFMMACSELFKYRNGEEWFVGHYLLEKMGA